jgi:hypothetical protein
MAYEGEPFPTIGDAMGTSMRLNAKAAAADYRVREPAAPAPAYPGVSVQLTGRDSNAFGIIGAVSGALNRAGYPQAAAKFAADATDCGSHDELLRLAMRTVEVR